MATTFEAQVFRKGGAWFMTMTISTPDDFWTSDSVMLDAETEDEAKAEADSKGRAARAALLQLSE